MLSYRMPLLENYENNFIYACIQKRTLLFYGRTKAAENLVLYIVPAAVSSHLSGGSLVREFTCPEVQTRNPTQPRVREKVKDYAIYRVRVRVREVNQHK